MNFRSLELTQPIAPLFSVFLATLCSCSGSSFFASASISSVCRLLNLWFPTWYQSVCDLFEDLKWKPPLNQKQSETEHRNFWEIRHGWGEPTPIRWHQLFPLGYADEVIHEGTESLGIHSRECWTSGAVWKSNHCCNQASRGRSGSNQPCGFKSSQCYVRCDPVLTPLLWNGEGNLG